MAVTIERLVAEIEADPEAAVRALGRLGRAIDQAAQDRTATIDIDTRNAERGVQRLGQQTDRTRASIKGLGIEANVTSRLMQGLGLAMSGIQFGALYTGASLLASGIQAIAGAAAGAAAALAPLSGLLGAIGPLSVAAGGGIGALILGLGGVTKAVSAYTKVQDQAKTAQASSNEAARRLASANRGVAEAHRAVADAAKAVKEAEAGVTQARKDAARALVEQRQDAVLAGFAQTEAVLALEEAQERLRKAQNRTRDGAKTLMKQTDDFTGKVYEVSFQSSDDVDPNDVAGAQRDVIRAQIEVERAKHRNQTTQEALNESEKKGIEGSDFVVDAKKRVTNALEQQQRASENLIAAQQRAADAQARLNEKLAGGSAATAAYKAAMAKLTDEGRAFVTFMTGTFMPGLKGFKAAAEKNLLPPLQEGLKSLMNLFPMLKEQTGQFAKIMGEGIRDFLKGISTDAFKKSLEEMFIGIQPILRNILRMATPLARIFVAITKAATPMTNLLVGKMLGGLERLANWMETARGQAKMTRFFNDAAKFAGLWWEVLKPLVGILGAVVKAAMPLAEWMLKEMATWLKSVNETANSISGQNAMVKFFNDQKPVIKEVAGLIKDFVKIFFDPAIGNSGLMNTLKTLRSDFIPAVGRFVKTISESNFGAQFVKFMTGIVDLLNVIVGAELPLGRILGKVGETISSFSKWKGADEALVIGAGTLAAWGAIGAVMDKLSGAKEKFNQVKDLLGRGKDDLGATPLNPMFVFAVNGGLGGGKGVPPVAPVGAGGRAAQVAKTVGKRVVAPVAAAGAAFFAGDKLVDWLDKKYGKEKSTGDRLGKSAGTVGKYAGAGAAAGSFIPVLGTGIGAAIGTAYGSGKSIYDWYWGSNKSQEKDSKAKAKNIAEVQQKAYTDRLNAILPPKVNRAGQQINDNLSLGMQQTKHKLYAAANVSAKIPDDSFKFNRARYIAAGKGASDALTTGLSNGTVHMSVKAREMAGIPSSAVNSRHPSNVLAGKMAGEKIGTGIATGITKSYAGISLALDALFAKLTKQSGDAAVATEKEIMRRTRGLHAGGTSGVPAGDGPGAPTPSRGNANGTAANMARTAIAITGGRITSSYRTPARNKAVGGSPTSYHIDMDNPAQDIVSPNMRRTFDFLYGQYGANIREMIYGNRMVKNGVLKPYTRNDHWDHVHVAHQGGVVGANWPKMKGLRSDERPAILQVGERVVPKTQVGNGGLSDAHLETILRRVMANAKAPVQIEQTFNEKVDPQHVGADLAWRLR